ncbi:hypothetical protein PENSUB_416 [Penicillium subrubescens]|uniref:CENP-V/GFA domain-containing protein n=1 Tax=Penicillium subrubescens TaxID=1316194 RepID=A0A1Q5UN12_9EURO|nr:hypothetical protein PENSUB_416 [Penicillium subrubescens]
MPAEIQATSGGTEQAGRQLSGLWHRDIVAQHREDDRHGHICFCRRCGSVIYREAKVDEFRGLVFVPVGSLDDIDSVSELKDEEWY